MSDAAPAPAGSTHMAREIAEQPTALAATFESLLGAREELRSLAAGRRRALFVARGSSDNAANYGRYLLEAYCQVSASLAAPSIATHYKSRLDLSDAVVVSVSQSGATEEIVQTQAWAAACGARTVAVTNVAGSPLAESADLALVTQAGPEVAVPATKTYTTQCAAMAVLATSVAADPTALDAELMRVPGEVARLIEEQAGVAAAVEVLVPAGVTVVSGRGLALGTAQETALKMEETCKRLVRGYSYADMRHGPISVVTGGVVAVLVAAKDGPMLEPMNDLVADLHERGATVVGIGGDDAFAAAVDVAVAGPDVVEAVAPIGLIVPAQVIIEAMARRMGMDPDAPSGLNKVTQTEVQA